MIENEHQYQVSQEWVTKFKQSIAIKALVSIIIPCYNADIMIARCLQSCFEQIYPNVEIIIVDNNSTDNSIKIARELASTTQHRVIFTHCYSQGQNYARNHGLTKATGDYIQWLDADDELTPNKIALQVAALEQYPDFDISYGDWNWCFFNQNGQCERTLVFNSQQLDDPLRYLLLHYWYPPHTYLLRRSAAQRLDEITAWNPCTEVNTDTEYFTLAACIGLRFLYVPNASVRYNDWSNNQTNRYTPCSRSVQSLKQMTVRFLHYAVEQLKERLTTEHWFLLRLNWDFWKLAPTQLFQSGEQCFWLKHQQKNVGMTLTPAEARIVLAMNQLGSIDTLRGHTNQIVHFLWKQAVQQSNINATNVTTLLSKWVGLIPDNQPLAPLNQLMQTTEAAYEHTIIDVVPLQTPLFTQERFAVLRFLDKLRVAGLLVQEMPQ